MQVWEEAVRAMVSWVEEHLEEDALLEDMARHIGYSPYYCSSQFHAISGVSIRTYIMERRLDRAALEIQSGNRRILDIALRYGYSSHEAFTRAFQKRFGIAPSALRKHRGILRVPGPLSDFSFKAHQKGEVFMLTRASIRVEFIPEHKYIGLYNRVTTKDGEMWPWHDCDLLTAIVQEMADEADAVVTAHTAGWTWKNGEKSYFYGLGVPMDHPGNIPEGFEIKTIPQSYYLVFSHPPFTYPEENVAVMKTVEDLAWNFDPESMGYRWNEEVCQDYQRHYPEGLGYQVLRPVKPRQRRRG